MITEHLDVTAVTVHRLTSPPDFNILLKDLV